MSLVWIVVALGGLLVVGWTAFCAKTKWIPEYRERRRQEEVLRRGRRHA